MSHAPSARATPRRSSSSDVRRTLKTECRVPRQAPGVTFIVPYFKSRSATVSVRAEDKHIFGGGTHAFVSVSRDVCPPYVATRDEYTSSEFTYTSCKITRDRREQRGNFRRELPRRGRCTLVVGFLAPSGLVVAPAWRESRALTRGGRRDE